ncbi:MAG: polyprenyl synthetase family protein [Eubacteriaceae bacterium]
MDHNLFREKIRLINIYINEYMDKIDGSVPMKLKESMKYSIFAGGKRLRPILLLETAKGFNKNIDNAIPLACAIEMIHTYSLIHDDLPSMDNDDYRRGKLTNHKVYGEDIAILAGDALLNYSFEIMTDYAQCLSGELLKNYLRALKEISASSGTKGMITGQVADIMNDSSDINIEKLNFINNLKTGALIKASVISGAIVQGVDNEILNQLTYFSEKIGLAFQIVDDILDVVGDSSKIGKNIGSDEKNNKMTYVNYYGIEKSKIIVEQIMNEAIEYLNNSKIKNSFLFDLTEFICKRDY